MPYGDKRQRAPLGLACTHACRQQQRVLQYQLRPRARGEVISVDLSPAQNAVREFKAAGFRVLGHEALFPGTLSSVMLLDAAANTLAVVAAPHLPEAYCASLEGMAIGPKAGSCGSAAATGKRVRSLPVTPDMLKA